MWINHGALAPWSTNSMSNINCISSFLPYCLKTTDWRSCAMSSRERIQESNGASELPGCSLKQIVQRLVPQEPSHYQTWVWLSCHQNQMVTTGILQYRTLKWQKMGSAKLLESTTDILGKSIMHFFGLNNNIIIEPIFLLVSLFQIVNT